MRLLQVTTGLNVGGAERVLLDMAGNLNPEKYEVLIYYLKTEVKKRFGLKEMIGQIEQLYELLST